MIAKEEYTKKKTEIEKANEDIKEKIQKLEEKRGIPKRTLEQKLKCLKNTIVENLNNSSEIVSEQMVDSFVEKIVVEKDRYIWKLNYLNDIIDMEVEGRSNSSKLDLYVNEKKFSLKQDCSTIRY